MVRWAPTEVSKLPLESADGDDAESVRWRLRERVAGPDGDDEGVASAGHPPGGGGCGAVLRSSCCMSGVLSVSLRTPIYSRRAFSKPLSCSIHAGISVGSISSVASDTGRMTHPPMSGDVFLQVVSALDCYAQRSDSERLLTQPERHFAQEQHTVPTTAVMRGDGEARQAQSAG